MAKVRGQASNSNGKTVEQAAWNGQKIPGDDDAEDIMSLVPGIKTLRLLIGLEFNLA